MFGGSIVYHNKNMTWVVLLLSQISYTRGKLCTGSMVRDNWVLTAGHCVEENNIKLFSWQIRVRIFYGVNHYRDFTVMDIHIHPNYVPKVKNDIALLRTFSRLPVTPVTFSVNSLYPTGRCTIAGYGQRGKINEPVLLTKMEVGLLPEQLCNQIYPGSSVICLPVSGGKSPCVGDSGSPLIYEGILIGVLSRGLFSGPVKCGYDVFGVILYEDLASKEAWIEKVFNKSAGSLRNFTPSQTITLHWAFISILIIMLSIQ